MNRFIVMLAAAAATGGSASAFGVGRGAAVGHASAGYHVGPAGGFQAGGSREATYAGPRGTTVQAGEAGGIHEGPAGGVQAGRVEGARVTTPGGETYAAGSRAGVAANPYGGVRVGESRGAAAVGPYGTAVGGSRAGAAVGPYGGFSAYRGGVAVGTAGAAGYRGVAVGHATGYVSPARLNTWGATVRTGVYPYFTPAWYTAHPVAWAAGGWAAGRAWSYATWPAVAGYVGVTAPPVVYDYGGTTVIHDDTVYVNGDAVASATDYAGQAAAIADQGRQAQPPPADDWQPLGVFGLVQGEEKTAQRIFQLAVNKAGVVRGNYYDALGDNTLPVYGSVDAASQRVAWSIGDKKDVVFETGLDNLTQPQTGVLVHYGKDRTEQMALVRLEQPPAAPPP